MTAKGRRIASLAVVLAAVCATPAAADPLPDGAFDFQDTHTPSAGNGATAHWEASSLDTFEDADITGTPRQPWRVLRVPAERELGPSLLEDPWSSWWEEQPQPTWTLAVLLTVDATEQPERLVGFRQSDHGLFVDNGVLSFTGVDEPAGTTPIVPGGWHQIVLTRDGATEQVRVYLDGALELEFADPDSFADYDQYVRLFDYERAATGGRIARARAWRRVLTADEVAALGRLDGTPPEVEMIEPAPGGLAGLRPRFFGPRMRDDGTTPERMRLSVAVHEADGDHVRTIEAHPLWELYGPQKDWVVHWPGDAPPLVRDARYTVKVTVLDGAGNRSTLEREFVAGEPPPNMVIHEPGRETTDPTPRLAGWTTRWEGDIPFVHAHLLVPAQPQGMRGVSSVRLDLDRDGNFAGDFVDPVPPGEYTLRVTHVDEGARTAVVEQPLRVLAPACCADPRPEQRRPMPSGADEALALRTSVVRALRRTRPRSLLRRPARIRFAAADPGRATVAVVLARRVLARGRRDLAAPGAATLTIRPTRQGRVALRRLRRARLLVRSSYAPTGGRAATATARVTLRR